MWGSIDREFIGSERFTLLNEQQIPFIIRIRGNTLIDQDHPAQSWFEHLEKDQWSQFGIHHLMGHDLHLGGIYAAKGDEPLILVSNRAMDTTTTLSTYRKRWEIETMFGAYKSRGFNLEETKLAKELRIEKRLALLALGFVWSIDAGEVRERLGETILKKRAHSKKTSPSARTGVAEESHLQCSHPQKARTAYEAVPFVA